MLVTAQASARWSPAPSSVDWSPATACGSRWCGRSVCSHLLAAYGLALNLVTMAAALAVVGFLYMLALSTFTTVAQQRVAG